MHEATVCFVLLASLACLASTQSRGYQRMLGESALRKYSDTHTRHNAPKMGKNACSPHIAVRVSTALCKVRSLDHLGNIGTCLTQESALTKCLSDADCPETKCCHRQRRRGGFGVCAYVCGDNEILVDVPSNVPVGSYRGDDFWNYWVHKRRFTAPRQRHFRRGW
ncbi:unnamed protein product [Taenia asiatica]|uniref:DB domain-containing protein n=1 Tax=Taenia asiatica TaxID=60517 RepID=A0A0R3W8U7_TAEAS|nr:unnamed protein product [Taenia asiatica]